MNHWKPLLVAGLNDAVRSRWMLLLVLLFAAMTEGLVLTLGSPDRVLLGLVNVSLLIVPLVSLVFGTIHHYNNRDFVVLVLTQPVRRSALLLALYLGLALPLATALVAGTLVPLLVHGLIRSAEFVLRLSVLLGLGVVLTLACTALAQCIAIWSTERTRGVGLALAGWLALAVAYDALILLVVSTFSAFPLERPLLALMFLNPIDLARVLLLLLFDAGALMGYTGAVFNRFLGSGPGLVLAVTTLCAWAALPLWLASRKFRTIDF